MTEISETPAAPDNPQTPEPPKPSLSFRGLAAVAIAAAVILANILGSARVKKETLALQNDLDLLRTADDRAAETAGGLRSLNQLKVQDIQNLKNGLSDLAKSSKSLYEAVLSLQEEKRVLEKQYKIMTTYLEIDEEGKKISLMSGEQALQAFPMGYPAVTALGGEKRPLSPPARIVSKERFAHPERAKLEESEGQLEWEPPQVGTSIRANALGEHVMFTAGPLILHGPPKKKAEHDSFPHLCLGLSAAAAQKLYSQSFIGTKIIYKTAPAQARKAPPAPAPKTKTSKK